MNPNYRVGAFQTNRQYSPQGQRIGFCALGPTVVFYDLDRCVYHAVNLELDSSYYAGASIKYAIMQQYDRMAYDVGFESTSNYREMLDLARQQVDHF